MAEALLITLLADGTFHVKETGESESGEEPIDQSVDSADDLIQVVQQWAQEESDDASGGDDSDASAPEGAASPDSADDSSGGGDMASAWNAEAAKRDPASGRRM